jgi:hypothetical protein
LPFPIWGSFKAVEFPFALATASCCRKLSRKSAPSHWHGSLGGQLEHRFLEQDFGVIQSTTIIQSKFKRMALPGLGLSLVLLAIGLWYFFSGSRQPRFPDNLGMISVTGFKLNQQSISDESLPFRLVSGRDYELDCELKPLSVQFLPVKSDDRLGRDVRWMFDLSILNEARLPGKLYPEMLIRFCSFNAPHDWVEEKQFDSLSINTADDLQSAEGKAMLRVPKIRGKFVMEFMQTVWPDEGELERMLQAKRYHTDHVIVFRHPVEIVAE